MLLLEHGNGPLPSAYWKVFAMPNAMNSPEAPENGKPRPHPLPEHSRRRLSRNQAGFAGLLVLIALIILVWIFIPH